MLSVDALNQFYGESHILWDVSIDVPAAACTCVMGRNGVGKTTLLRCVMGLLPVRGGRVLLGGQDITALSPEARARAGIGYVPQGREIFAQLSVEENLRLAMSVRGDARGPIPARVLELFPVLGEMLGRRGGDLSGGQQQQLAIARALVLEPRLLVLDEPTEGIQPNVVRQISDVIGRLVAEDGLAVLLVEQKLPFARRTAERFYVLDKGRVVASGAMAELDEDLAASHLAV